MNTRSASWPDERTVTPVVGGNGLMTVIAVDEEKMTRGASSCTRATVSDARMAWIRCSHWRGPESGLESRDDLRGHRCPQIALPGDRRLRSLRSQRRSTERPEASTVSSADLDDRLWALLEHDREERRTTRSASASLRSAIKGPAIWFASASSGPTRSRVILSARCSVARLSTFLTFKLRESLALESSRCLAPISRSRRCGRPRVWR